MIEKCAYCDDVATNYCDSLIGMDVSGAIRAEDGKLVMLVSGGDNFYLCDAPLCKTHAVTIGRACEFGEYQALRGDSIDRCPYHAEHGDIPMESVALLSFEVDDRRKLVRSNVMRHALKKNNSCNH